MTPAKVTINIQTGSGAMYTGPVQINYAASSKPLLTCYICGRRDEGVQDRWYGNCHPECEQRGRIEARRKADEIFEAQRIDASHQWRVIASEPAMIIEQASEPLQISAPQEPEYTLVRDDPAKYATMTRPYHIPLVKRLT